MTILDSSMRMKVNRDTFYIPDQQGGVYFRNNTVSFRMEGGAIDQWIEKLLPMFNGEHTLEELTDGLQDVYRNRVYEIAQVLYNNGFIRDLSKDHPHQLPDNVLQKYASQIEFLDSIGGSGAYRFQNFRRSKVLVTGSGPILVSLIAALLESGLPRFHVLITDSVPTNRVRLTELEAHAYLRDPDVAIDEITFEKGGVSNWRDAVQSFDMIMYVSQVGDVKELRSLHAICKQEKKAFLPAIILQQAGLAGPFVHPDTEGCWESAYRRIHLTAVHKNPQHHSYSCTAGAMLANVLVFELLKSTAGLTETELRNKFYLLNLETLEGNYHSFIPHPLVTEHSEVELIQDLDLLLEQSSNNNEPSKLLAFFSKLTSTESGIFHIWDEENLKQLPLSQCRVQAVDPLSDGPAQFLAKIVSVGQTHQEARREAGLSGVEAYVSRMAAKFVAPYNSKEGRKVNQQPFIGIGAGETIVEGVARGLQQCLAEELREQSAARKTLVTPIQLSAIEDEPCRYYMQALATMQGTPKIGLGEEVSGLPVIWVRTGGQWYSGVGLNATMALRSTLKQVLLKVQNKEDLVTIHSLGTSAVLEKKSSKDLPIPALDDSELPEILRQALQILKQNKRRIIVYDLKLEPFIQEYLAGVFGVMLREEVSL
jgi:putative thiazole-containing bacteriocin maturation protein